MNDAELTGERKLVSAVLARAIVDLLEYALSREQELWSNDAREVIETAAKHVREYPDVVRKMSGLSKNRMRRWKRELTRQLEA